MVRWLVSQCDEVSLEDIEGLLVQIGIMAALALNLSVGVFSTVQRQDLMDADFRDDLFRSPDNRNAVVSFLQSTGFNFTTTRAGVPFDILAALTEPIAEDRCSCWYWSTSQNMQDLDFAFLSIKNSIPMYFFGVGPGELSWKIVSSYGISISSLVPALLTALFLYATILASSARERYESGDDTALRNMSKVAVPTILVLFILVIVGVVGMFMGMAQLARVRYSWVAAARLNSTYSARVGAVFCCAGFLLAILVHIIGESSFASRKVRTKAVKASKNLVEVIDKNLEELKKLYNLASVLDMEPEDLQEFGICTADAWAMAGYAKELLKDTFVLDFLKNQLEMPDSDLDNTRSAPTGDGSKYTKHEAPTGDGSVHFFWRCAKNQEAELEQLEKAVAKVRRKHETMAQDAGSQPWASPSHRDRGAACGSPKKTIRRRRSL